MKKILILLFTFFSYSQLFAQDLEFSQVKLVNTLETVPEGKVWKVTNVLPAENSVNGFIKIRVNGILIIVKSRDYVSINNIEGTAMSSWTSLSGAFWLPAGTTLSADMNCEFISVIEFSIQ